MPRLGFEPMATKGHRNVVPGPDEIQDRQRGQDARGHRNRDALDRDETCRLHRWSAQRVAERGCDSRDLVEALPAKGVVPYCGGPKHHSAGSTAVREPRTVAQACVPTGTSSRFLAGTGPSPPSVLWARGCWNSARPVWPIQTPVHELRIGVGGSLSNGRGFYKRQLEPPDPVREPIPPSPRKPAPWREKPTLQWM